MRLIKNTALNAAQLYKLLGNGNQVYHKRLGPTSIDKIDLLKNPASDSAVLYTSDGSDSEVFIREINGIIDFDLN